MSFYWQHESFWPTQTEINEVFDASNAALCRSVVNGTAVFRTLGFKAWEPAPLPRSAPGSRRDVRSRPKPAPRPKLPVWIEPAPISPRVYYRNPYQASSPFAGKDQPTRPGIHFCPRCDHATLHVAPFVAGACNALCLTCGFLASLPVFVAKV
jgi:hypothetical protein